MFPIEGPFLIPGSQRFHGNDLVTDAVVASLTSIDEPGACSPQADCGGFATDEKGRIMDRPKTPPLEDSLPIERHDRMYGVLICR